MDEQQINVAEVSAADVVFECPHCGKSMVINQQATGLVITCPDCQASVQVPEGPTAAQETRPAYAAKESAPLNSILEQIGNELGLIQASIDRIVSVLQDAGRLGSGK
jgi:predicted RNA-binding Zn-ribbon protein involved in translation (DUF1610 family)